MKKQKKENPTKKVFDSIRKPMPKRTEIIQSKKTKSVARAKTKSNFEKEIIDLRDFC